MTIWASEVHENSPRIRIHSNHGNSVTVSDENTGHNRIEVVIEGDYSEMKGMWSYLGSLIEKKERQARGGTQAG